MVNSSAELAAVLPPPTTLSALALSFGSVKGFSLSGSLRV